MKKEQYGSERGYVCPMWTTFERKLCRKLMTLLILSTWQYQDVSRFEGEILVVWYET
jgi:hypothetical protein